MMNVATLEAYLARTSYCMITKSTSMGRKKLHKDHHNHIYDNTCIVYYSIREVVFLAAPPTDIEDGNLVGLHKLY